MLELDVDNSVLRRLQAAAGQGAIERVAQAANFGAARAMANELEQEIKEAAPVGSGRLRDSIRVRVDDSRGQPNLIVTGAHHGVKWNHENSFADDVLDAVSDERIGREVEKEVARWMAKSI